MIKALIFLLMLGTIIEAVNKIRSLFANKEIDKEERIDKIEKSIFQILGALLGGWLIIAVTLDNNSDNPKTSSQQNEVAIPFSDKKFSTKTVEEAYEIIWKSINYANSSDNGALLQFAQDIEIFVETTKSTLDKLSPSERNEVFAALFEKMNKQQQFVLSSSYIIRRAANLYTSTQLVLYLPSSQGQPYNIEKKSLDINNVMLKRDVIESRLYPKDLEDSKGKIASLGAIAYRYQDIQDKFEKKFEDIRASAENKIAHKFQSFYQNFDNKSEKEQFYFCSGIAVAALDINNPPVLYSSYVPVDYAGLMQLYRDRYTVQVMMQENQNKLVRTNAYIENTMKSRAAQYFGWGVIQYGALTDAELDMIDTGRLAAYFDVDMRNNKQLVAKCKVIFKKMSNQSEKTLENKGYPYVKRLMDKYKQTDIRYYFTENQYLQQGASLYGLYLNVSKSVYERNENIVLTAKWNEDNANCEVLTDKVKETLTQNQFEIVENGISCSKDTTTPTVNLSAKIKTSKLGKISIPAIKLDDDFSNGIDFIVKDTEALKKALISKDIKAVKDTLSAPEDLNAIKIEGKSPVAHFIKDDTDFAKELIKLGASPNEIDENGYTPLMYAVIRQDNELLDLLLDKNVYLNELDKKGRTAIMYAAIKNNIYAAKKLVKHKADIYKSKDGKWSAYLYAQEMKHIEIAELLKNNKDRMVLIIDKCDACKAKEKIFLEQIGKLYPTLQKAVIKETPDDDRDSTKHSSNFNYPFVKIGDKATLDKDITNAYRPDHRLDKWDGTEKHLEQIMYKD